MCGVIVAFSAEVVPTQRSRVACSSSFTSHGSASDAANLAWLAVLWRLWRSEHCGAVAKAARGVSSGNRSDAVPSIPPLRKSRRLTSSRQRERGPLPDSMMFGWLGEFKMRFLAAGSVLGLTQVRVMFYWTRSRQEMVVRMWLESRQ